MRTKRLPAKTFKAQPAILKKLYIYDNIICYDNIKKLFYAKFV